MAECMGQMLIGGAGFVTESNSRTWDVGDNMQRVLWNDFFFVQARTIQHSYRISRSSFLVFSTSQNLTRSQVLEIIETFC
mmetsp:Transcript_10866/g.31427  ORF Transcript_10866/g.31427 Transcript_10866/m.31427 type:complete len:80 (-) Transcript_10866:114-353(-)